MALAGVRITELLEQLDRRGGFAFIEDVEQAWDNVRQAIGTDGLPAAMTMMDRIVRGSIDTAHRQDQIWEQIGTEVDRRARLALTEQRRITAAREFLTVEEAFAFANQFIETVNMWVDQYKGSVIGDDERRELASALMYQLDKPTLH